MAAPNQISAALLTALLDHQSDAVIVEDNSGQIFGTSQHFHELFPGQHHDAESAFESIGASLASPTMFAAVRSAAHRTRTESQGHRLMTRDGRALTCSYLPMVVEDGRKMHWWVFREEAAGNDSPGLPMDFLASMSHEFRTPLNAIIGMTDLIQATRLTESQKEFVGAIQSNSDALLHLINDILDYAKLEAGQLDIESRQFNISELLDSVAEILGLRAERKGVQLVLNVEPNVPRRLMGDINRLRQVLINLVSNAVKFTDKGRVTVRASLNAPFRGGTAQILLEVIDTGIGISEAEQEKVFDKYFRSDQVRRIAGTGLGLHITRSLVELMGGTIALQSEEGQGTTVAVSLSLQAVDAFHRPKTGSMTRLIRQMRVLIADRDEVSRNALSSMLTHRGFQVETVGSGEAVFNAFAKARAPFDALIIDRDLPDLDGVHVAHMLRANRGLQKVSVILLGSMAGLEQDRLDMEGISDVIARPVKESRLLRGLMKQLRLRGETMTSIPALPAVTAQRGARILMAEDNPDNQTYGRIVLEKAGHHVDIAEDGQKAVEMANSGRYDLILMDVQMPVMNGLEAAVEVRARERKAGRLRVPIIALTGHAVEGFRERVLESGMDDYVTKPIRRQRLLDVVAEWMDIRPVVLAVGASDRTSWLTQLVTGTLDVKVSPISNLSRLREAMSDITPRLALVDAVSLDAQGEILRHMDPTIPRVLVLPPGMDSTAWKERDMPVVTGKSLSALQNEVRRLVTNAEPPRTTIDRPSRMATEPLAANGATSETEADSAPGSKPITVEVDPDLMELIPGYLESRRNDLQRIRVLVESASFEEIARLGHNLKGSGGGYGFDRISELGAMLETAAKANNEEAVRQACINLQDYLDNVNVVPGHSKSLV